MATQNQFAAPFGTGLGVAPQERGRGFVANLGWVVSALYLFLLTSRLQDFVTVLHLPLILTVLAILLALLSGQILRVLPSPITRSLILFSIWVCLAIPFSIWRGGSVATVKDGLLKAILVFAFTSVLTTTVVQVNRTVRVAALGFVVLAISSFFFDQSQLNNRVGAEGRFGDPNELALAMLLGCCFIGTTVTKKFCKSRIQKVLGILGLSIMLFVFLRTGSRGGLIGGCAVVLALFLASPPAGKLKVALLVPALTVVAALAVPTNVLYRYLSMFDSDVSAGVAGDGSVVARRELFRESIAVTLQYPIFGVGPGMFMVAENDMAKQAGKTRGSWHETHNMYTQVSSETGLPGLLFFVCTLAFAFRSLARVLKVTRNRPEPVLEQAHHTAFWLRVGLLGFCAGGLFLSVSYTVELQTMLALALALDYAVRDVLKGSAATGPLPTQRPLSVSASRKPIPAVGIPVPAGAVPPTRSRFRLRGERSHLSR